MVRFFKKGSAAVLGKVVRLPALSFNKLSEHQDSDLELQV